MPSADLPLAIRDLSVHFRGRTAMVEGVRGASLDIAAGECVVLLGESGSGKSLLGLAAVGLLPDAADATGSVRVRGAEMLAADETARRGLRGRAIAFVPQSAGLSLNPVRTVGAQVAEVHTRILGLRRRDARVATERLLTDQLGLPPGVARMYPHLLSGGMRQRVLVAIGMAATPDVLVADEPTKGLDADLRDDVVRLFTEVRTARPHLALLLITHDIEVAEALADRVVVLYAGAIVEDAPAAAFFGGPRHPYARGLLAASPRRGLVPIPGTSPEPGVAAPGCAFAPRCDRATSPCRENIPGDRGAKGHRVFCHDPIVA